MSKRLGQTLRKSAWIASGLVVALLASVFADEQPSSTAPDSGEAAAPKPAEAEKFKLEFKFRPGEVVRYEVMNRSEMKTIHKEAWVTDRNLCETRRSYTVHDVAPDGAGEVDLLIEWVHMVEEKENEVRKFNPIEFQSDDPAKQPPKFFNILDTVGRPQVRIRFSPTGRPLEVKAIDPNQPQNPNAGAAPGTDVSYEDYLMPLPHESVAIGDEWIVRYEVIARDNKFPVRIAMQRTYKLTAVKDGQATIESKVAILTPEIAPAIGGQLIERETAGRVVFDIERGLIASREVELDKTVVMPFGPGSSMRAKRTFREKLVAPTSTADRDASVTATTTKK